MADPYDPMKDPAKHTAPEKTLVDRIIEMALGAGGGIVSLLSGLLAAVLILYSGYVLYDTFATERAAASNAWDLLQFKPEILEDPETPLTAASLKEINEDYRAWLTVYDTNIDYPIVQGPDDLYYASHDIYHRTSLTGAIYLAAANSGDFSDSYNVIYGHHMDNGAMFGGLDHMTGAETGVIISEHDIYDVEFFAIAHTDAYESRIYSVGNRMDDVLAFLRSGGEGGVGVGTTVPYFNESVLTDATKIVALSTCADAYTSGRLVVFGKMTRRMYNIDVTVKKVWDDQQNQDGLRPGSLTVTLSSGETAVLNEANSWTATLTVPKYDDNGEIQYTWTEENVSGYELSGTEYDEESRTTTLTNRHVPEVTSVSVTKVWDDDGNRDGIRPESVTAVLSNGTSVVLSEANGWTATIDNLPAYSNGQAIAYTWTEVPVAGYELTVDGNTLINTHTPETTTLSVRKVWKDKDNQDGIRPESVVANLYGNNEFIGSVTLSEDNQWKASISGLYVNEPVGKPIEYRWEEEPVDGYGLTITTKGKNTTLTNTHQPETVDLTVYKIWDDNNDQDRVRPRSLRVTLSNGRKVTLNEENGWTATITGLPKYKDGQEIEYSWTEARIPGYEQTGYVVNENLTMITNRHETETTVVTVIKVWDDDRNRDGIRPGKLRVTLSNGMTVVLNPENNWTATITGLPMYENGKRIEYTWTEEKVEGYTLTTTVSGTTTTLINTHKPETFELIVRKVWEDDDPSARPSSLNMVLTGSDGKVWMVTLSDANNWEGSVRGLQRYASGKEIKYTWTEPEIPGYELVSVVTKGNTTIFTNKRKTPETPPEEYTLTVYYRYLGGEEAAPTHEETHREGEPYDVESPHIEGYRPIPVRITGTMPGRDVEYTVIYIPIDETIIEYLETPLGLGRVEINIGDCLE